MMRRTTVNLPDDLKRSLEQLAAETARSESDLIRGAVRLTVKQRTPAAPRAGMFASGDPSLAARADELLNGFGEQ